MPPWEIPGHPQASLGQSPLGSLLPCPGSWCTSFCCALEETISQVLCKFLQPYGGVNGDLLQEGLCHTQVCCTQSPCPCTRPQPTHTSTGDTQTQFSLSPCGVPGFWCTQGLFEPSEHLWQEWGLILNVNLPHLPSCWGFPFAVGCGVSPHSHSSTYRLTGVFWPWTWGISSQLLKSAVWRCSPIQPPLAAHPLE